MSIGEQIKKYRKEANLSQRQLGERLGISQQMIAQYENGKRIPKIETINNIAGALGMGIRKLYPEFSYDEWKQTETCKTAVKQANMRDSLLNILSLLYGDITSCDDVTEKTKYNINYTCTVNNTNYLLRIEDLEKIIDFIKINIPFLFENICLEEFKSKSFPD